MSSQPFFTERQKARQATAALRFAFEENTAGPAKLIDDGGANGTLLDVFIPATPRAKQRPRMTRGGHCYTPQATVDAEKIIRLAVSKTYTQAPFEGAVTLDVTVVLARPKTVRRDLPTVKPDWDNFGKLISDALNGVVWRDDAQVIEAKVTKQYCGKLHPQPGYKILVEAV
jgi:Holliday junction resolvase RusA-like endonuclease